MPTTPGGTAASEWGVGALLTRGKSEAIAINPAASFDLVGQRSDAVINCENDSTLIVEADMTGGAAGDLTVAVNPLEANGVTVMPIAVPVVQSVGPTLSGGHVFAYFQYDVTGIDAVRVRLTNNNIGAQTITRASWRLA